MTAPKPKEVKEFYCDSGRELSSVDGKKKCIPSNGNELDNKDPSFTTSYTCEDNPVLNYYDIGDYDQCWERMGDYVLKDDQLSNEIHKRYKVPSKVKLECGSEYFKTKYEDGKTEKTENIDKCLKINT